jgi:hypothetical protein
MSDGKITVLYPLVLETGLAKKTKEILKQIEEQQRYKPANDNKR